MMDSFQKGWTDIANNTPIHMYGISLYMPCAVTAPVVVSVPQLQKMWFAIVYRLCKFGVHNESHMVYKENFTTHVAKLLNTGLSTRVNSSIVPRPPAFSFLFQKGEGSGNETE